jgi:DNA-binding response OmpR family regulator
MASRIFLFHWNQAEAEGKANRLSHDGWDVEFEDSDGARGIKSIKADPPDAVVIDLNRLPSHGRETALALKSAKSTRDIPIVFVDGEAATIEKIKAMLPDAIFTKSNKLNAALAKVFGAK